MVNKLQFTCSGFQTTIWPENQRSQTRYHEWRV